MKHKREFKGFSASSKLLKFKGKSGRLCAIYIVEMDGIPEYRTSAAISHKEAVRDAILFWIKKGFITEA